MPLEVRPNKASLSASFGALVCAHARMADVQLLLCTCQANCRGDGDKTAQSVKRHAKPARKCCAESHLKLHFVRGSMYLDQV